MKQHKKIWYKIINILAVVFFVSKEKEQKLIEFIKIENHNVFTGGNLYENLKFA